MLKCVVFVVTEYGFRYLEKHRKSIDETLNGAGVKTVFLAYEETDAFAEKEVLYITDNSKTLKNLLKKNLYAIALHHDKNRDVSFADALYAVEYVEELTYKAYDEVYRRLAGIPWDILETQRLKVRESTVGDVKEF